MTVNIGESENISKVQLVEQGSNPSMPTSGFGQMFAKSDGLYFINGTSGTFGPFHGNVGARVYHNANIALTGGVTKTLTFNSEYYDTDNIHDTSTNNERLTCKIAGNYTVTAQLVSDTSLTAADDTGWIEHDSRGRVAQQAFSGGKSITINCIINLAVNDYLVCNVYQQTGAVNIIYSAGNEYSPTFSMQRIG